MAEKSKKGRRIKKVASRPKTAQRDASNSVSYLLNDYPRTLFPLSTTRVIAERWGKQVLDYVYQKVLNPAEKEHSFLAQARCYSSKPGFHLRRTVKLDPVAELFIYDFVYRNRLLFRKDFQDTRSDLSGTDLKMASPSLRRRAMPRSRRLSLRRASNLSIW
jgi:hypothetical protein